MSDSTGASVGPNWLDLDAELVSRETAAGPADGGSLESFEGVEPLQPTGGSPTVMTSSDSASTEEAAAGAGSAPVSDAAMPSRAELPVAGNVGDRLGSHRADDGVDGGSAAEVESGPPDDAPVAEHVELEDLAPAESVEAQVVPIVPRETPMQVERDSVAVEIVETGNSASSGSKTTLLVPSPADLQQAVSIDVPRETLDGVADLPVVAAAELDGSVAPATPVASEASPARDHETPIAREAARAVQVLNVRQERWPSPARTRVLTVANQKGGVGKTTSAVNIAAALALHGLNVLLIDLDPQGNASTALGIEHGVGTPSIYDVLLGGQALAEVAQTADFAPTLRCVPATLDLAGADIELTSQVAREYRLQKALLTFLEAEHAGVDYVIIDCPPSLGLLTLNALVAAREVLLPIQCEYYALEGLAQLLKTVDLVTSHLNPYLVVTTVLLTMYDSRTRLADQVADEVRRHFGPLVLGPTIPRNVRVSEAPGFGQTVITYDPGSRGAIGYVQAAQEIAERGARGEHENIGQPNAEETS